MVKELLFTLRMGANDPQCFIKLLRHAAKSGYRRIILELDRGIKYHSLPEVSAPWAWDQTTLKTVLNAAQANGLEIVPLVPALSHAAYLLTDAPEFAEKSSKMYCPHSGVMEKRLFPLLEEVISIFTPRKIHIGHDEIISSYYAPDRRPVFNCPECCKSEPAETLLYEITKIHKFLSARGISVLMWADSLLDPECFKEYSFTLSGCYGGAPDHFETLLPRLPRDIMLYDWHYEVAREFPTTQFLRQAGFETASCCAHELNAFIFGNQAKKAGSRSLLATLWHRITETNYPLMCRKLRNISNAFDGKYKDDARRRHIVKLLNSANVITAGKSRNIFNFKRDFSGILRCHNWSDLRFTEFPESNDENLRFPEKPDAVEIKKMRKGWLSCRFKIADNCSASISLKLWMTNPGHNAVYLEYGGKRETVLCDRCCRGNSLKLPELTGEFTLIFEADNCTSARQKFLRRFELISLCKKTDYTNLHSEHSKI